MSVNGSAIAIYKATENRFDKALRSPIVMTPARSLTVQDMLRLALPLGTQVLAGRDGLARLVSWPSVLQTRPPAFPDLVGQELALLTLDSLRLVSDKLTLANLVTDLAESNVSAIAFTGKFDPTSEAAIAPMQAADLHGVPLLLLPPGTPLLTLEQTIVRVLVGPPPDVDARSFQLYEQLLRLFTENRGLDALVAAIADATGRTVVVQDKRLDTLAAAGPICHTAVWPQIETQLTNAELLPPLFLNREAVAQITPDPARIELLLEASAIVPDSSLKKPISAHWLVVPIVANLLGRGFFSLLVTSDEGGFDALDMQFVQRGAAICALEMAKAKAIREEKKRVQGGLLEQLLSGALSAEQAMRQLSRLGHQPQDRGYAALAAAWVQTGTISPPSARRLETMFNEQVSSHNLDALVQVIDDGVVIFCHAEGDALTLRKTAPRAIRQLADTIQERARIQFPHVLLAIGMGRPVRVIDDWRSSYQEALAAQRMAAQWRIETPTFFGDLGVYRLLSLLIEQPELRSFYRETLGELASDRYTNDEFLKTLETFFEEDGNLSQTAKKLNIHRNTLLYRMDRIGQIGSFDLTNPETRLAVHLALKIRRLINAPIESR
jgi:purine catabolism regulator